MKLTKHRHRTIAAMNMTPMIDIVFLLIIFFMTVTQVSRVNRERLDLPDQEGAAEQPESPFTINVRQNGQIVVSGRVVRTPELVSIVADEVAGRGGDPSRVKIVLRGDARGNSRTINEIVEALDKIDVTRINLAVEVPR